MGIKEEDQSKLF